MDLHPAGSVSVNATAALSNDSVSNLDMTFVTIARSCIHLPILFRLYLYNHNNYNVYIFM